VSERPDITDGVLIRAIAAHRTAAPWMYRGVGLTKEEEEEAMRRALFAAFSDEPFDDAFLDALFGAATPTPTRRKP
jgi:hypothetical protein